MSAPSVQEYREICATLRHIPKRARARMKRNLKRWTLKKIDPNNENRSEALRTYRGMWNPPASQERTGRK
jgi:hypothetical protein